MSGCGGTLRCGVSPGVYESGWRSGGSEIGSPLAVCLGRRRRSGAGTACGGLGLGGKRSRSI